jgi:hypothetical protein
MRKSQFPSALSLATRFYLASSVVVLALFCASCSQTARLYDAQNLAQGALHNVPERVFKGASASFGVSTAIAMDSSGCLIIADVGKNCVHKIHPNGRAKVLAGGEGTGVADGIGQEAQFFALTDIAVDAKGNVVVIDGQRIRRISPRGVVTTLAGSLKRGNEDGIGVNARFNMPSSLALDAEGNIFVADIGNGHVRRINPQGRVETLPHTFGMPTHIAFDKNGKLLVLDRSNACVYALNPNDGAQKVEIQNATLSVVVRFSELELPSHYSALTIDSNNNILLVEEGEKTVIRRIQPNGIVRVLFDKTRDIVSVADVCIMPFSQTILFTNVRDNGVYKMQISSSMKLSEESMTSVIEHEVK